MTDTPLPRVIKRRNRKKVIKRATGSEIIKWIESTLKVPEGRNVGKPVKLLPFQKAFIKDTFDNKWGTRYAILSLSRKNGKTALTGFIALAFIIGPLAIQNSQIIAAAQNAQQAAIIFKLMAKTLSLDPELMKLVKITNHRMMIQGLDNNVEFKSIAKGNVLGLSPLVVIIDEIGSIPGPNDDFVESLLTAQGAYDNPMAFMISTQAASDTAMLSQLIDNAPNDKHTVCHLYSTPMSFEMMDEDGWLLSNPGLGPIRSKDDLRISLRRAMNMPSAEASSRNLLLNQRVAQDNLFISVTKWKEAANTEFAGSEYPLHDYFTKYFDGKVIHAGLDLSTRIDLTACVLSTTCEITKTTRLLPLVFVPSEGLDERGRRDRTDYIRQADNHQLFPIEGNIVSYEDVISFLSDFLGKNTIEVLCFDRWNIENFKTAATAQNFTVNEWLPIGQGFAGFAPVANSFECLLMNGQLEHPSCPALNTAASSAIVTIDPAGNRKVNKAKSVSRIDPLVASIMAAWPCGDAFRPPIDIGTLIG